LRFIGYNSCETEELKTFAVARGLVARNKKPSKGWLVDILLEADTHRTFSKLYELPAELRKMI
jgi:hypothetical protein